MALRSPYVRDDDLMLAGASAGAPYDAAQPAWFALILPTATLCSLLLTCSLAPSAVRMWRTAMPGSVGFAPFLSTLANGILSLLHSLVVRNPLLRLCGVVSTVAGLAYVSVAISVAPRRRGKVQGAAAVLAVALALAALLASGSPLAGHAIGVVFSGCGVWVQTAPLAQARNVIRTGVADGIPLPTAAATLLTSVAWFMHAVLARDRYLQGLNVVGVTAGALQLALLLLYPAPADVQADNAAEAASGGLAAAFGMGPGAQRGDSGRGHAHPSSASDSPEHTRPRQTAAARQRHASNA